MKVLQGLPVSEAILHGIKDGLNMPLKRPPVLVFILIGQHLPSQTYVNMKIKGCALCGIESKVIKLNEDVSFIVFKGLVQDLNQDESVDGIIIQMPLPKHLEPIVFLINPKKDVDGFTATNMGKLVLGDLTGMIPCTPQGIFYLLRHYDISCEGKHVVIMGRSHIVGKPLANLLSLKIPYANGSVTLLHSNSQNVKDITKTADILIVAIGHPQLVDDSYIKKDSCIIDVGINRINGKIVGDTHPSIQNKAGCYSPVPGGIGPMTIACLLLNTYLSYKQNFKDVGSSKLIFEDHLLVRNR